MAALRFRDNRRAIVGRAFVPRPLAVPPLEWIQRGPPAPPQLRPCHSSGNNNTGKEQRRERRLTVLINARAAARWKPARLNTSPNAWTNRVKTP